MRDEPHHGKHTEPAEQRADGGHTEQAGQRADGGQGSEPPQARPAAASRLEAAATLTTPGAGDASRLKPAEATPAGGLARHPAAVYLARLAPSGRRTQQTALSTIAGLLSGGRADVWSLPWQRLSYAHTQAVRTVLAERYAPATANRHLAALRGVLGECWRLELMDGEVARRAGDLAPVRGCSPRPGRALTGGELAALFATCQPGRPGDVRDAAVLALLYGTGLRRAEAVALDVADYTPGSGALVVRRGKGRKARTVWAAGGTAAALDAWLQLRGGAAAGPLLVAVDKAGRLADGRLSGHAVRQLLLRRAATAGVAPFSPHDLRRSCVSDLLEAGVDVATVAALAGHASVTTTAGYDRRPEHARRQAAGLLHVPYRPPSS